MHVCLRGAFRRFGLSLRPALAGALAIACLAPGVWAQTPVPETTVKAAFIVRFPEFVTWPASAEITDGQPGLVVCLSPAHPYGTTVSAQVRPHPDPARSVTVRALTRGDSGRSCHVLYVAAPDAAMLDRVAAAPVLTVGDFPGFCQRGGIINMLVIDGRVRFEINLEQARRTGLRMDSQLLRLATRVIGGQP